MNDAARQAVSVFNQALEFASAEERAAYLARVCGSDHGLRARVEGLLQAHEQAGDFLRGRSAPPDPGTRVPGTTPGLHVRAVPPGDPAPGVPPELADHPRFRILRELGRGGMGVVYLAEHRLMERRVAIKVIARSLLANPNTLTRFHGEVKAAARLDHPHIVRAYDAEQAGDLHLLVMEFVEGVSLAQFLERKGPLPIAHACHFVRQAALGLQHAHERGMVHRDIKPQNLMLTPKGQVKILDFGLARVASERVREGGLTVEGVMMGTPEYVAPEQAVDARQADIRADLYSLGCTLFCLLTGRPPFQADTAISLVLAHLEKQAPPLHEVRPDVPAELSALVARLLAKNPAQRFQTPAEVALALAPFCKPGAKPGAGPVPASGAGPASQAIRAQPPAGPVPPAGPGTGSPALAVPVPSPPAATSFSDGLPPEPPPPGKRPAPGARPAAKGKAGRRRVLALGAAAVVLLGLGAWGLAGVLFKVKLKTPGGEAFVVLEVDQPGAEVEVDGDRIAVHVPGDNQPVRIKVGPGQHRLRVSKDGFEAFTRDVELKTASSEPLHVRLVPEKAADRPAEGFVPLFNGKDLTGWRSLRAGKAKWAVQEGVLIGTGGRGHLSSDGKAYANFHLRVEAMINDGGGSGIFFRAPFGATTPEGDPATGYEARINVSRKDPHRTGSLFAAHQLVADVTQSPLEIDRWFTLEVIARGQQFVVKVNGKVVASFIEMVVSAGSGRVALQVLGPDTVVKFRKVEIKELPPGNQRLRWLHGAGGFEQVKGNVWMERNGNWGAYFHEHFRSNTTDGGCVWMDRTQDGRPVGYMHLTRGNGAWFNAPGTTLWTRVFHGGYAVLPRVPAPEKSPAARPGEWVPLFNGKDLAGWEATGNIKAAWACEDEALVCRPAGEPAGLLLSRRADYDNFHLRAEVKIAEGANSSIFLRCGPADDGLFGNKCYAVRLGNAPPPALARGSLVASANLDDVLPLRLAAADRVAVDPGKWFRLEVLAEGNRLRVQIEGKKAAEYIDANATFTAGKLGLICRGTGEVRFRKIEINELPSGGK